MAARQSGAATACCSSRRSYRSPRTPCTRTTTGGGRIGDSLVSAHPLGRRLAPWPYLEPAMSIGVMTSVRRVVAIGVVGVASVLGGCGDDASEKTVDATKLEHEIEQSLSTTTTKVSSASCPDDVKNETGTKFACKAQLSGGGSARVAVTIT